MPEVVASVLAHPRFMLALWLHTAVDPPQTEWEAIIERLGRVRERGQAGAVPIRQLVVTDGGAPNAVQRTSAAKFVEGVPNKLGVITTVLSNPIKRGVATAIAWLNPAVRFYQPHELEQALQYLELTDARVSIKLEFRRLQRELAAVNALAATKF